MKWFVTVEDQKGRKHQRLMDAEDEAEAGRRVCDLIGGPNSNKYHTICCVPAI